MGVPINKAHLLKAKKAKKLRQSVQSMPADTQEEVREEQQEEQNQQEEHDQQEEHHEEQIHDKPQILQQSKYNQTEQSTNKRKNRLEDKVEHEQTPKIKKTQPSQHKTTPSILQEKRTQTETTPKEAKSSNSKKPSKQRTPLNLAQDQPPQLYKQTRTLPQNNEKVEDKQLESPTKQIQKAGEYYVLPFRFAKKGSVVRQLLVKHDSINNMLHILMFVEWGGGGGEGHEEGRRYERDKYYDDIQVSSTCQWDSTKQLSKASSNSLSPPRSPSQERTTSLTQLSCVASMLVSHSCYSFSSPSSLLYTPLPSYYPVFCLLLLPLLYHSTFEPSHRHRGSMTSSSHNT